MQYRMQLLLHRDGLFTFFLNCHRSSGSICRPQKQNIITTLACSPKTWANSFISIFEKAKRHILYLGAKATSKITTEKHKILNSSEFKEMSQHTQLPNQIIVTLTVSKNTFLFLFTHTTQMEISQSPYGFRPAYHSQSIKTPMPYL